ncbi:Endo-1,4-beta-xylanase A precursor [Aedoeadaptatus ivorii]|uniref:Endo-1,4-beta-xylanase A n=1 Tax=Aedoeadaptatus ivorii TaxID=54006 RepID=A0A3S5AI76_9FIRM|nr:Endo-1,4-beta-xylanase A precursor [Peptoniphilus ivorii]
MDSKTASETYDVDFTEREKTDDYTMSRDINIAPSIKALIGKLEREVQERIREEGKVYEGPFFGPTDVYATYDSITIRVHEESDQSNLTLMPQVESGSTIQYKIREGGAEDPARCVRIQHPNAYLTDYDKKIQKKFPHPKLKVRNGEDPIFTYGYTPPTPLPEPQPKPPAPNPQPNPPAPSPDPGHGQDSSVTPKPQPAPDQGTCPAPGNNTCPVPGNNTCKPDCNSGCPDINININNENNSSANNNNVNNNTNVGRDQYNVNQNANPNPNLKLDRYNHFVYVHGYPDRSFRPEGTITRGEMTAIFRRLLDQGTFIGSNSTAFRDVRSGDWYASDVDRLSTLGVISGYPDGSFRPNASVTRAEFASVAAKFVSAKSGQGFSDLNGHWAQNAIEKLNSAGWVSGYGDGSFRPDSVITRAEVVSIVNRMLDRQADAGYVQNHRGSLIQYTDLAPNHWAYLPIMEASNAHDYTRNSNGSETWTRNWK